MKQPPIESLMEPQAEVQVAATGLTGLLTNPVALWGVIFVLAMYNFPILGYCARTLRVFLSSKWKPRLRNWWEGSTMDKTVMPSDLDWFFHMNNSRYLYNMDFARVDWFVKAGFYEKCVKTNMLIAPVVGSATIKYRRELNPFQKYQIVTEPIYFDEKYFYMLQQFVSPQTRYVHSAGLIKYVFLHKGKKLTPADFLKVVGLIPKESTQLAGVSPKFTDTKKPVTVEAEEIDLHDIPTVVKYFSDSECNLPLDCLVTSKKHN